MSQAAPSSCTAADAWRRIGELVELERCRTAEVARELELSSAQLVALRSLDPDEPRPMGRLAGVLECDKGNVTGIVDRLERRGLVERRPDPQDRRVKLLALTPQGEALRAAADARLAAPPEALTALADADLEALLDVVGALVDARRERRCGA